MCLLAICLLCRLYIIAGLAQVMVPVSYGCCDNKSRSAASWSGATHFEPDGIAINMYISSWSIG